jgi:hypothetical protein
VDEPFAWRDTTTGVLASADRLNARTGGGATGTGRRPWPAKKMVGDYG